jgi:hypothetical protein
MSAHRHLSVTAVEGNPSMDEESGCITPTYVIGCLHCCKLVEDASKEYEEGRVEWKIAEPSPMEEATVDPSNGVTYYGPQFTTTFVTYAARVTTCMDTCNM